jgi:hypothetical protein
MAAMQQQIVQAFRCYTDSLRAARCVLLSNLDVMEVQEVKYEPGEETHTSRSRASEEAAILLIVAGHIDTVLMPSAARLSAGSSAKDMDELCGSNTNSGDDFSLDGDIIGAQCMASSTGMLHNVHNRIHALFAASTASFDLQRRPM